MSEVSILNAADVRTIFVDDHRYDFNGRFITGASIANMTTSGDRVIKLSYSPRDYWRDWEVYPANGMRAFELRGGEHFYTHPAGSYVRAW